MPRARFAESMRRAGLVVGMACVIAGCGGRQEAGPAQTVIQVKGSDTMVNVAQAWAEEYRKAAPSVDVDRFRADQDDAFDTYADA